MPADRVGGAGRLGDRVDGAGRLGDRVGGAGHAGVQMRPRILRHSLRADA